MIFQESGFFHEHENHEEKHQVLPYGGCHPDAVQSEIQGQDEQRWKNEYEDLPELDEKGGSYFVD
jgi:hypothetical protein